MPKGKIVLATGAFDLLHPGHLRFLEESRKRGGPGARLVVVIARDKTVQKRKGKRPILPERQRQAIVAALKPVNQAILGHETVDFLGILKSVRPNIITVGHDQNDIRRTVSKIVKRQRLPIRIIQIPKYGPPGLNSSTVLKRRIIERQTLSLLRTRD